MFILDQAGKATSDPPQAGPVPPGLGFDSGLKRKCEVELVGVSCLGRQQSLKGSTGSRLFPLTAKVLVSHDVHGSPQGLP